MCSSEAESELEIASALACLIWSLARRPIDRSAKREILDSDEPSDDDEALARWCFGRSAALRLLLSRD